MILLLMIVLFYSCHPYKSGNFVLLNNDSLAQQIVDFSDHANISNIKNRKLVMLSVDFANSNTVRYKITSVPDLFYLFAQQTSFVTKLNDVYVIVSLSTLPDFKLSENTLIELLRDDFPWLYDDYKKIKKAQISDPKIQVAPHMLVDDEYWEVTFINDSLVSKRIINKF